MYHNLIPPACEAAVKASGVIMSVYQSENLSVRSKADLSPVTRADRLAHQLICASLEPLGLPVLSEEGRQIPYEERKHWARYWLVDPLDGTREFIAGNGEFTVNIALMEQHTPVWGVIAIPVQKRLYYGGRDFGVFCADWSGKQQSFEEMHSRRRKLPLYHEHGVYRVACSRSHLDEATLAYVETIKAHHPALELMRVGSSVKYCLIAEGAAHAYPRFGTTMEWDTAAGQALLQGCGKNIYRIADNEPLTYNKADLRNPDFVAR